jgi:uncharacterized protein (UPF0332 family)
MTKEKALEAVVRYWMQKASRALASSRTLLEDGDADFAINRAYYAAFYAASAVLLKFGKRFTRHSGVRSAVHRDLVKAGLIDPVLGNEFDRLFLNRQSADYGELVRFETGEAARFLRSASLFVREMRKLLRAGKSGC